MTSQGDNLKTNEFLRLRKLRLQQVREQSKDIAKKIRQRAKVEQLRHVSKVDVNKEKEYLQHQEKLVKRLELLYSKGLQNVGDGHKNATEVNQKDNTEKKDLSKLRGKEAAAELRRKKQEKLDEQKKLLDRKLQAREIANGLSREKITGAPNIVKSTSGNIDKEVSGKGSNIVSETNKNTEPIDKDKSDPLMKNDMGTQWEFDEMPNVWEQNVPALSITNDDSVKNFVSENVEKSDQAKRVDLFALSEEMPSSLRGSASRIPDKHNIPERGFMKPSSTLVSEYLQARGLRLREPDLPSQKRSSDDLQSIKETLQRTRASRTDGSVFPNICHVLDEQVIPVPCWRAERNCGFCSNNNEVLHGSYRYKTNSFSINKSFKSRPSPDLSSRYDNPHVCPRNHSCRQGQKFPVSGRSINTGYSWKSNNPNKVLNKKASVTVYDHNTRDTRDIPHNVDEFVIRDQSVDDDAYSQAHRENSAVEISEKPQHKIQQEARNRVAIERQTVDKEYRDTLAFLNSLPKERPGRSIRTAYMNGDRQQEFADRRQRKLQKEYKKIEKQCSKHHHTDQNRITRSPAKDDTVKRDFEYSWMPVPESDGSLAIHTIPTNTVKDSKTGNTVKFSSVDTYHEYRSRHKHTPPTKEVPNESNKRGIETVMIEENSNDSIYSTSETDTSSVDNLQYKTPSQKENKSQDISNAEKIIIYKVVESKKSKKRKMKKKPISKVPYDKSFDNTELQNTQKLRNENAIDENTNTVSFTELKEGIYKSVSANGDNIAAMYFSDDQQGCCNKHQDTIGKETNFNGTNCVKEHADTTVNGRQCGNCKITDPPQYSAPHPSAATSTSSFKTAVNDKSTNALHDGGYIQFIDKGAQDSGTFYVGASGFLKDDAYEVIIQLRKKETDKICENIATDKNSTETSASVAANTEKVESDNKSTSLQGTNPVIDSSKANRLTELDTQQILPKEKSSISTMTKLDLAQDPSLNQDDKLPSQIDKNDTSVQNKTTIEPAGFSDKGVSTTFRDSFAIPDNVPKSDPISRPATSIHTQTTLNSPPPIPMRYLSSSTSTIYMSPPDLVLPRYLRKNSSDTYDDMYELVSSNVHSQNIKLNNCETCKYGKCENKNKKYNADTPPNTTRSTDQTTYNSVNEHRSKKCRGTEKSKTKHNSHKCKISSEPKICSKKKLKRNTSDNKRIICSSNYSSMPNTRRRVTNSLLPKVPLNPVIETYVKKLLNLNKESLKAIEVVNQQCSNIATPSSSIIDVPSNINRNKPAVCNKISLEQIKNSLKEHIRKNIDNGKISMSKSALKTAGSQTDKNIKQWYKPTRKRSVHKVKSLNISKQLIKTNKERRHSVQSTIITTSPCSGTSTKEKNTQAYFRNLGRPANLSSPRHEGIDQGSSNNTSNTDIHKDCRKPVLADKIKTSQTSTKVNAEKKNCSFKPDMRCESKSYLFPSHRATITSQSSESESSNAILNKRNTIPPISISTQTNQVDSEVEFMKLAENKLQNMEKIADLTEKCTQRLSNLAKVLEEVRKNKSLAYSQISTSDTTDSDQKSDKNVQANNNTVTPFNHNIVEIQTLTEESPEPAIPHDQKKQVISNSSSYVSILKDLPKPDSFKTSPVSIPTDKSDVHIATENQSVKHRGRPPPALTRINLKHVSEGFVVPHELSTVVEVDSPMSVKLKSYTSPTDDKRDVSRAESLDSILLNNNADMKNTPKLKKNALDTNLLISNVNLSKNKHKTQSTDSSDDSKLKMMDLKHFNEIMLKPFVSLQEYAKQYNLDEPEEGSSRNGVSKYENINEEFSSLHSEASLPDVMAELLKRNLISEPFKFETTSNVNSTTVSSESTISMLALSRPQKDNRKSALFHKNKENIAETSGSLSLSSNPDLEHVFQKLGMGWASSTLRKTKERLALSSSSNTSSSSMAQLKMKSFNYHDVPELSKESIMSLLNMSNKEIRNEHKDGSVKAQTEISSDNPRHALQQTSLTNSMTVKEFLANELAKKITFSKRSNSNDIEDEFLTLCETKMPEDLKKILAVEEKDKSVGSPSGTINRARTSTPVQIYKSKTYHSTSSSNTSNGLFSNADDLSSVKVTSNSMKNHSTSDKDDLTIPNYSLTMKKGLSECSKSD